MTFVNLIWLYMAVSYCLHSWRNKLWIKKWTSNLLLATDKYKYASHGIRTPTTAERGEWVVSKRDAITTRPQTLLNAFTQHVPIYCDYGCNFFSVVVLVTDFYWSYSDAVCASHWVTLTYFWRLSWRNSVIWWREIWIFLTLTIDVHDCEVH